MQQLPPSEYNRRTLNAAANMSTGTIICCVLFYPVCQVFNHAVKHTHHIKWALKARSRLRESLSRWTYILYPQIVIIIINAILITLDQHSVQDISSILNNLRSQHVHFF